ncbi:MAG: hypothetical protein LUE64_03235 [Candidatus Gastranaerophilales bacterium]|nr:hypothetical protein [Candidatus Gastranaerophilales bacterium]
MIIDEIKTSISKAIYQADSSIVFHFEEIPHTGFPCAVLILKNFQITPSVLYDKQKCNFSFELVYMKSSDNKISELLDACETLKSALLPAVSVLDKKITLDDVEFLVSEKKLVMKFCMNFYMFENDESETMETLDITLKGE